MIHTRRSRPAHLACLLSDRRVECAEYVAAFEAVDTDGSGTISKRELYSVLRKAGLAGAKQSLEVFEGFDADSDGQLDLDEFTKIAKILTAS